MYEGTKQTANIYNEGWQTRLKELDNSEAIFLLAPASFAKAASDGSLAAYTKASGGKSGGYASSSFEFQCDAHGQASP